MYVVMRGGYQSRLMGVYVLNPKPNIDGTIAMRREEESLEILCLSHVHLAEPQKNLIL